jgi:hypothetical protein
MNTRTCTHCHVSKPATLEHFYKGHTNSDRLTSWCKDCMRALSKVSSNQQRDPKPRDKGEALALTAFLNQGIHADLGKNIAGMQWVDIVLWGCIKVEVKYSQKAHYWQWIMNSTNNPKTHFPDAVILIGKHEKTQRCHHFIILPNHPMFINEDGSRKRSISYSYLNRMSKSSFTIDPLLQHENNYGLIEKLRLAHSQQLIAIAQAA